MYKNPNRREESKLDYTLEWNGELGARFEWISFLFNEKNE